jgi:uncharacterized membrane protein YphA (DoxX/SURF4 family)
MPRPEQILEGLTAIANDARPLAILWHVLALGAGVAFVAGWRPARRPSAVLLTLPLLSAAAMAWVYRNPFNGTVLERCGSGSASTRS